MNEYFMKEALYEAKKASLINEVPIGAVVVKDNNIIGRGHNLREHSNNALDHAEIIAIDDACRYLKSWRLENCDLYVTIEPCLMCAGAIINSRIKNLYYGAPDYKAGVSESLYHIFDDQRFNHHVNVEKGILADQASYAMKTFFKKARKRKKLLKKLNNSLDK
ncbi:nucleoside deaminase [Apilactobacillus micheneri]|uniref:tRNA-specific adenosine deaminase n=1 Tax=Apilactobacillus micheneri TaxID=1899430 RepID=A0ABY2YVE7_9LACO|nr:tRNA adenosine(34) deaminase TadA [Apilactobacillus micheneri]TPR24217.1 nucleoside deaminase [Apilactobacillus micheneri]TPR25236.1 nucleoside deaminase [Apilactobacillus micheneri]TPR27548.1 nucleoside deaminase [Apilactobacillus micheneri]TPR28813.1 nucleoside deaminase [Apilactobacillus micheneri]TPR29835.1 nucleoside deaminase [Apilactobacillus micheneri]